MTRTLIQGGCVLSMDPATGNHHEADVLIDGDIVTEIGQDLRVRDAEVTDARDAIVMPGFVDTHRHVWESLFRGLGDIPEAPPALLGSHYDPDDLYAATTIGLLGAVEAGITTVADWSELPLGDGHPDAALQAHSESGLRTVFVHATSPWAPDDDGWRHGLRRLTSPTPLTSIAAGIVARRGVDDADRVAANWSLARDLGLRIHVGDGLGGGDLGDDVTLVHCPDLDGEEIDSVASSGASVTLTPSSDMAAGLRAVPIQPLIDRGIRPGLGIGTERLSPGDIFAQMRAVISLQHATSFALKLAGKAGIPRLLSTREVIRYGTVDGAGALGLGGVTGSLAPGKQADIVLLRTDHPNIFPINDPIGAVVWGMDTSNVDWVFVAGRPLMRGGVLDADLERARRLANASQHRVAGAAGLLTGAGGSR